LSYRFQQVGACYSTSWGLLLRVIMIMMGRRLELTVVVVVVAQELGERGLLRVGPFRVPLTTRSPRHPADISRYYQRPGSPLPVAWHHAAFNLKLPARISAPSPPASIIDPVPGRAGRRLGRAPTLQAGAAAPTVTPRRTSSEPASASAVSAVTQCTSIQYCQPECTIK
jgi:hypothetical protein